MFRISEYGETVNLLISKVKFYKSNLILLSVSLILTTIANLLIPKYFGSLVSDLNTQSILFLAILLTTNLVFQYSLSYQTYYLSNLFSLELKKDFINTIIDSNQIELNTFHQGEVYHKIFTELGAVQGKLIFGFIYLIKDILFFTLLLINIFIISKLIFIVLVVFAVLFYVQSTYFGKATFIDSKKQNEYSSQLSSQFIELLNGKEDIQTFQLEKKVKNEIQDLADQLTALFKSNSKRNAFNLISLETLIFLFIGSIVLTLMHEGLNASQIVTSVSYILFLAWPIKEINNFVTSFYAIKPSLQRLDNFLKTIRKDKKNIVRTIKLNHSFNDLSIKLDDLNFNFSVDFPIAEKINYKFEKGTYLLKGKNGSGKTTLLKMISGILPAHSGSITINYNDNGEDKHNKVQYISQKPFLFSGTILENFEIINPQITEQHIHKILTDYKLEKAFSDFEKGLHTQVGENGKYISAGQKQLISIVRGLIEDPQILLFDEITSNLSESLQKDILQCIYHNRKTKINIIVSHDAVENVPFDKLITLNNGTIC